MSKPNSETILGILMLLAAPLTVFAEQAEEIPAAAVSDTAPTTEAAPLAEEAAPDKATSLPEVADTSQQHDRECSLLMYPAGSPRLKTNRELADRYLAQPLPPHWKYTEGIGQTLPVNDQWWNQFDDPVLNQLISLAEKNNFNLKAAYTRIASAKAQLRSVRSEWYPTLSANAGWTRTRSSGDASLDPDIASTDDYMTLALGCSWEIDVFGRVASKSKAASAGVAASEADYVATQIALSANVAKTYITMRQAQARLAIANEHLATQEKIVRMTRERMECGLGNKLEVSQSMSTYLSTKASIPAAKADVEVAKNALATLCGVYPVEIEKYCTAITPLPVLLQLPDIGLPADLLRRRPDILEAEQNLAAAAAKIGIAKKDFLPTLSINAQVSTMSHEAKHLFRDNSLGYNIAPQLSWTIFDGFARNAAVTDAKAQMEEAIDNYNQTVLNATQEVNNQIAQLNSSWESISIQLELLKSTRESLNLALDLYKRGLTQFTNVTDAQINVLDQENQLVSYKANTLKAAVSLYEAVGGGY